MVTGGTSPIGACILQKSAPHASTLVSVSRQAGLSFDGQALMASHGLPAISELAVDLRRTEQLATIDTWFQANGIDTLVNNAGVYLRAPAAQGDWQIWLDVLSVNLIAAAEISRLAVAAGCTRIVNIVDAGWHRGWPNHSIYLASKAAMVSLTRTLAAEWAPKVQVNAVAPGIITLPGESSASPRDLLARIPAGRFGKAEEVASMVVTLLLAPDYVTGQVIAVDGGYSNR